MKAHGLLRLGLCALVLTGFAPRVLQAQTATAKPAQAQTAPKTTKKAAASKTAQPAVPQLEAKAIEILKATSERLASAHAVSFTAEEAFESLSRQGDPLVYVNKYETVLRRPDRLRVITAGDGPVSEFYYDGKVMMAYDPVLEVAAVGEAPATIDATLELLHHKAGVYFPFTDLIVADPYKDLAPTLQLAYYVGQSKIVGDTVTDIIALGGNGVFMQLWIGVDDKLPRLAHAVYFNDPAELRHNLVLSNWKLELAVNDDAFTNPKAGRARRRWSS